ncbi:MAG: poly(R)-hydroxyalkanoic acid synthase subunit PhaE [Bacteroidota bacterium]
MKTNNPIIENIIDSQATAINTWIDSAKKIQAAFTSGNPIGEAQNIYKDILEKQVAVFNGFQSNNGNSFTNGNYNPEEFFKNWYSQQLNVIKQLTDFNQSIYNSTINYGKTANDINNSFSTMNNAWTNIYNNWIGTINTTYDTLSSSIKNPFNKDIFKHYFEGSQLNSKIQEVFQPILKAIQNNDYSIETWKTINNPDNYKKITEQVFGSFFNQGNLNDVFENSTKQLQNFFVNQNNLGKEYFEQIKNINAQFPELFSGNSEQIKDLYSKINNVFGKTFEPLLKLTNVGKEKENIESTIELLDKVSELSIKQSELQSHLYKTMQSSIEDLVKETQDKYKDLQAGTFTPPSANDLYNEWVKRSEKLYSDLFNTDEFSKVKADVLSLNLDVKKHFEKQFENLFEQYPIIFKSELEEVYKTIHDLKNTVKELQNKLALKTTSSLELIEEEKALKAKKK